MLQACLLFCALLICMCDPVCNNCVYLLHTCVISLYPSLPSADAGIAVHLSKLRHAKQPPDHRYSVVNFSMALVASRIFSSQGPALPKGTIESAWADRSEGVVSYSACLKNTQNTYIYIYLYTFLFYMFMYF